MNSLASRYASAPVTVLKDLKLTVTVVICTRNHPALLRKCLEAIAQLRPTPDEVIVVDNTTGDTETECLARKHAARYIVEATPGLSRARNRGLTESSSETVAFLDDDSVPEPHWLGFLIEPFAIPGVAIATGKIVTHLPSYTGDDSQETPRSLSNRNTRWFEIAAFGGVGLGSNMALRRAACAGRKVFDERLGRGAPFQGCEEHHAFARLLSHGFSAVYIPSAIVFHPPLRRRSIQEEATCAIAYWLLLFFESPGHRFELTQFLFRRLRRRPLNWTRDPPGQSPIISSGWRVRIKAGLAGTLLYLRARKSREEWRNGGTVDR